jgi:hypothetical protein
MPTESERMVMAAAILGLRAQKKRIEARIAELLQTLDADKAAQSTARKPAARPRRTMSRSARARIPAAQRKRWAEARSQPAGTTELSAPKAPQKKRRLSAAGRQRIIEATRRRWARDRREREEASAPASKNRVTSKVAVVRATEKGARKTSARGRASAYGFGKVHAAGK